jgi:Na+/H+ antiporter NhaD/arsenite permease-like protein
LEQAPLLIFLVTYAGVALGGIPGLALDRTGIALLGAIAMVACGVVTPRGAVAAIDIPTILLLYALMVVSAQFRLSGFYTRIALLTTQYLGSPRKFLLALMGISAVLSAILANDIVCLAFTPVICLTLLEARINPLPFLIGLAVASNIGSATTIIGNPQNMLLGQLGKLPFGAYCLFALVPSAIALAGSYGILILLYRNRFHLSQTPQIKERRHDWPAYNQHQSRKGLIITVLLLGMFFTPVPREVSAIALAGILLCSRKLHTRSILGLVDWHLITLFCALFIVIAGLEITHLPSGIVQKLSGLGVNPHNLFTLAILSAVLSNLVSNVPAAMLLVKFLNPAEPLEWQVVALSSTFAGNLITIGSIANLIVIEGAQTYGVTLSFREHARAGIPITLFSLLVTLAWIGLQLW